MYTLRSQFGRINSDLLDTNFACSEIFLLINEISNFFFVLNGHFCTINWKFEKKTF